MTRSKIYPTGPFSLLPTLQNELNTTLERFWGRTPTSFWAGDGGPEAWIPSLDLKETPEDYLLKMEVPGVSPDDIQVEVEGDELRIQGETRKEEETTEGTWHRKERRAGTFLRTLQLPSMDPDRIKAACKEGVLELKVGKREERKGRKVKVEVT